HLMQHGKEREDIVRDIALIARQRRKAGAKIFLHRQQRKDFAPLRHVSDAGTGALVGTKLGDVLAAPDNLPLRDRMLTDKGAQKARLAGTVPSEHASDLAWLGDKRHRPQCLRRTVVKVD